MIKKEASEPCPFAIGERVLVSFGAYGEEKWRCGTIVGAKFNWLAEQWIVEAQMDSGELKKRTADCVEHVGVVDLLAELAP